MYFFHTKPQHASNIDVTNDKFGIDEVFISEIYCTLIVVFVTKRKNLLIWKNI